MSWEPALPRICSSGLSGCAAATALASTIGERGHITRLEPEGKGPPAEQPLHPLATCLLRFIGMVEIID
jgi:hypothetical protein